MKTMNVRILSIICLATGLVAGYALRSLFTGSALPAPVVAKQIAVAKQEQQQQLRQYEARMEQMATRHARLDEQLNATRQELAKVKTVHATHVNTTRRLARQSNPNAGTIAAACNCDSLAAATLQLLTTDAAKDSLYEQTIRLMEHESSNKDSVIAFQAQRVGDLQQSLAGAIEEKAQLADANNALLKQIKRHTRKQKLLSAVALIVSGAAAYGLVR
jgi:hypothetical protein